MAFMILTAGYEACILSLSFNRKLIECVGYTAAARS